MLVLRLARIGKKNKPEFRLVVQEKRQDPFSTSLETIGFYNPRTEPATISLKIERIKYWLSKGAQPTATVHNMLVNAGVITGEKMKVVKKHKAKEVKNEEKPKE